MFQTSRRELTSRNSDIKIIIAELPKIKVDCSTILKSSIIVMIYNMIEGVFFHILQESFDKVAQNENNCPDEFLFMVADYYFRTISNDLKELNKYNENQKSKQPKLNFIEYKQSIDTHKNVNNIQNNFNKLQTFHHNIEHIPSFSDYISNFKLFSGNLDEKEIRKHTEKFGAKFNGVNSDKLLTLVKEKRNKLAHGEAKYSIECRDMLDTDIKKIQRAVFGYMKRVIQAFEKVYI
ncbi:MAE_28990/MAE_18760 family HEPN-like nuclease [Helicobacter sp. 23-1048]